MGDKKKAKKPELEKKDTSPPPKKYADPVDMKAFDEMYVRSLKREDEEHREMSKPKKD